MEDETLERGDEPRPEHAERAADSIIRQLLDVLDRDEWAEGFSRPDQAEFARDAVIAEARAYLERPR